MKIKIGKYIITTNGRGWEVYKPVKPGPKAKNQDIVHRNQMFYSTLEALLKCLPERMVMTETNASTLSELLEEIRSYNHMVEAAMKP